MTCPFCKSGNVGLCSVDEEGSETFYCYRCQEYYVTVYVPERVFENLNRELKELNIPDYVFFERWANWMLANRWYFESHFDKPLEEWEPDKLKSLKRFIEKDLKR